MKDQLRKKLTQVTETSYIKVRDLTCARNALRCLEGTSPEVQKCGKQLAELVAKLYSEIQTTEWKRGKD